MPPTDFPHTEEGLQSALAALATARERGDTGAEGWLLLDLAQLVKWVRSDNEESPFERSYTLAREAEAAFRSTGDNRGLARALCSASPFATPKDRKRMLAEAERIARELGDRGEIARVISTQSRILAASERAKSVELAQEALAIYRDLDDASGMGGCLFSLSIQHGESSDKRGYAVEAYECFAQVHRWDDAAMVLSVAAWNCTSDQERLDLEPMLLTALENVTRDSRRWSCARELAEIEAIKGNLEGVAHYQAMVEEADAMECLTPLEKWETDVTFTQMLVQTCKRTGNKGAAQLFKDELSKLRKQKPPA